MKTLSSLAFLAIFGAIACTADSNNAVEAPSLNVGEVDEALRPLDPSEVVGTIASGQTVELAYPRSVTVAYRALEFTANKGDLVRATVSVIGQPGILALATIADIAGTQQASWRLTNSGAPSKATFAYYATSTGRFRIVTRERFLKAATITVTLSVRPPLQDGATCYTRQDCVHADCTQSGGIDDTQPRPGYCGGPRPAGASCYTGSDCNSVQCNNNVCAAPVVPQILAVPPALVGKTVTALSDCGTAFTFKFGAAPVAGGHPDIQVMDCEEKDRVCRAAWFVSSPPAGETAKIGSWSGCTSSACMTQNRNPTLNGAPPFVGAVYDARIEKSANGAQSLEFSLTQTCDKAYCNRTPGFDGPASQLIQECKATIPY
jgi:hypothetical protein